MVRRASYQGAPELLLNEAERAIAVAADVACTAAAAGASEDSQAIRRKAEGAKAFGHHPGWQPGPAEIAAEGRPLHSLYGGMTSTDAATRDGAATPSVAQDGQLVA
jgi:hypothetical protein